MEKTETTRSKCRKLSSTSPIDVATQIRKKYQRMQERHSPLSATARRLLLRKVCPVQGSPSQLLTPNEPTWMSQLERLRDIVKDKYPRLLVEENNDNHWIVISKVISSRTRGWARILNLLTFRISPSTCVTCPLAAFGGSICLAIIIYSPCMYIQYRRSLPYRADCSTQYGKSRLYYMRAYYTYTGHIRGY